MKRIAILIAVLVLSLHATARAQEKGPLAMQVMLEWTVGGMVLGAGLGALIWLTDPGRPGNRLGEQLALGAAWGSVAGAAVGLSRLNTGLIPPVVQVITPGPLHPASRITGDPVGDEEQREDLLASLTEPRIAGGRGIVLPLFNLRF